MSSSHQQNISGAERVGRVVLGAALVVLGVAVGAAGPTLLGWIGAVVAVGTRLDFVVTGARGYCPLYARLEHVPRSLRGAAR